MRSALAIAHVGIRMYSWEIAFLYLEGDSSWDRSVVTTRLVFLQ
jgi:hypothetical protein